MPLNIKVRYLRSETNRTRAPAGKMCRKIVMSEHSCWRFSLTPWKERKQQPNIRVVKEEHALAQGFCSDVHWCPSRLTLENSLYHRTAAQTRSGLNILSTIHQNTQRCIEGGRDKEAPFKLSVCTQHNSNQTKPNTAHVHKHTSGVGALDVDLLLSALEPALNSPCSPPSNTVGEAALQDGCLASSSHVTVLPPSTLHRFPKGRFTTITPTCFSACSCRAAR